MPLLFMILSCNKKTKYPFDLINDAKAEFIVALDAVTPPDTKMMQFFEYESKNGSLPALAMLNSETQSINIHNRKGQKIKEISLPKIDTALQKISGFYFINEDSLLLYSYSNRDMKLISIKNNFAPKLLFNLDSIANTAISTLSIEITSSAPILYKNGIVYLAGRAMFNDISDPKAKKVNTAFSVDVNTRKIDFIPTFEKVWKERYWHYEQTFAKHTFMPQQNTIIYSLPMKDSVLVYNTKTKNHIKAIIQGDELGNENEMVPAKISDPSKIGNYEDLEEYLKKPRYGELIFDKYRNVYYRFISAGDLKRVTYLIICDLNFKKIGETKLSENYLAGAGFFLAKEGLFLRRLNVEGENKIVYNLFKLTKSS